LYLRSRAEGFDHEAAARAVWAAYGGPGHDPERLREVCGEARADLERPAAAPEPVVEESLEPDELDALEADAKRKVREAEAVEERLSLDALTDPAVAAELQDLRSERRTAEDLIGQIGKARRRRERLRVEAADKAEQERLAKAQAKADKRAHGRPPLEAKANADLAAAVKSLTALEDHTKLEEQDLRDAGHGDANGQVPGVRLTRTEVEGALWHYFQAADSLHLLRLGGPVAGSDIHPLKNREA
jgi:hypothetical protein